MSVVEFVVVDVIQRVGHCVGEIAERVIRLLLHHQVGDFCRLADRDVANKLIVEVTKWIVVNIL